MAPKYLSDLLQICKAVFIVNLVNQSTVLVLVDCLIDQPIAMVGV